MPRHFVSRVLLLLGILWTCVHCGAPAAEPGFPVPSSTVMQSAPQPLPIPELPDPITAPPPVEISAWGQRIVAPADATIVVLTDPGDLPHLEIAADKRPFPLVHTGVRAHVRGGVAEVEVTQTYQNPSDKPIEAIYIFPLPENSAVYRMRMVIGERVIEADVRERELAQQMYEDAKRSGHTAALLEQERPNIFTQSVANIEPGKQIDIKIQYLQDLTYDAGQYEFVFPMVVGPRYNAHAKDADRIRPPIMGQGERSGTDISLEVNIEPGPELADVEVPTHEISKTPANRMLKVAINEKKSLPNRDFVMRWRVVGAKPQARLLMSEPSEQGDGYFSLLVHPPELPVDTLVGRREIIFVVDVSGSMYGTGLALCDVAIRRALLALRPMDTFNIVTFAGRTRKAFEKPRLVNPQSLRDGLDFALGMRAGGGTEMAGAVKEALTPNVESGRHRYVFFLTDGFIGGEAEIFADASAFVAGLEAKGQRARVFAMGIGASPNRHLIEGLSRAGKGLATYAGNREDPIRAVNQIYHYIDRAVLTNVEPDLASIDADDVFPAEIPDLFASRPIVLHGHYKKAPTGPIVVRAKAGREVIEMPVDVRQGVGRATETLGRLWARKKVEYYDELPSTGDDRIVIDTITKLGLKFHLVTRYTSLIAIDTSQKVGDGNPGTIVQPVDAVEDVEQANVRYPILAAQMDMRASRFRADGVTLSQMASGRVNGCYCRFDGEHASPHGLVAGVVFVLMYVCRRRSRKTPA